MNGPAEASTKGLAWRIACQGRRPVVLLVAVAAIILGLAGPAWAHPILLATSPPAGYSTAGSPLRIELTFDEGVSIGPGALSVRRATQGTPVLVGGAGLSGRHRVLSTALPRPLAAGRYDVHWRVTAADGDTVDGDFSFAVTAPGVSGSALPGTAGGVGASYTAGRTMLVVLRWLLFAGLALALGGQVAELLMRPGRTFVDATLPTPAVLPGALLGLLAACGLGLLLAGNGSPLVGLGHLDRLSSSPAGLIVLVEAAAFAATALLALRSSLTRHRPIWVLATLTVVVMAEALRNHVGSYSGALGVGLIVAHLLAAAVWVGALVHVLRLVRRRRDWSLARRALVDYARLALLLYAVVVTTGTISAIIVLPSFTALWRSSYGQVLLVKITAVAVVSVLAVSGRFRLRGGASSASGWPIRAERASLLVVLGLSAMLVSLAPPRPVTADLALPLSVAGPAVRLGTLLGQVSTQAVASQGRLEVRVSTPEDGRGEPTYRLTAQLLTPSGPAGELRLVGCGTGCFTAAARWSAGGNRVRLRVAASGWHGGEQVFDVPWPPRTDSAILQRVVASMRAARAVAVREADTSDTSRPVPSVDVLRLSGASFIDSEPYGGVPTVSDVITSPASDGRTELTFALPAEAINIRMLVGADGRIIHEDVAASDHLLTRDFTYPAG